MQMDYNFSKKSNTDEDLDALLDSIFAVCDNEMGWTCDKPSAENNNVDSGDTNDDFIRKTIDDTKDSLEMLYNNLKKSSTDNLDTNNHIIRLLEIQTEINNLNRDVVDFQGSVNPFISQNQETPVQGNMQAINDIISLF